MALISFSVSNLDYNAQTQFIKDFFTKFSQTSKPISKQGLTEVQPDDDNVLEQELEALGIQDDTSHGIYKYQSLLVSLIAGHSAR
jgi:hypothetical protein